MKHQHFIEKLQSNQPIKVEYLKTWLYENQNYLHFLVSETTCSKWSLWLEDKSTHILPCHCFTKNEECNFIETYKKIHNVVEVYARQNYIFEVLKDYEKIRNDFDTVYTWVEKNYALADFFSVRLLTNSKTKTGNNLEILLDEIEFETAIKFESLIFEIYCTEEYQIREKLNKTTT